jgi:hypothetical protein
MRYHPEPLLFCVRRLSKTVFHKETEGRRDLFLLESGLVNKVTLRTSPSIRTRQPYSVNYATSRKTASHSSLNRPEAQIPLQARLDVLVGWFADI